MNRPTDVESTTLRVGVYGGTFDPIHYGHLRCAWEVAEALKLNRLHMIPAGSPPLRGQPGADGPDRSAMLSMALAERQAAPELVCDDRELGRQGPSYTFDTLQEFRSEYPSCCLWLVLGEDAFSRFDRWYRWDEFLALTNLLIVPRPGFTEARSPAIASLVERAQVPLEAALDAEAGALVELTITPLAISATEVRALLAAGRSPRFLTPDSVIDYIQTRSLYKMGVQ